MANQEGPLAPPDREADLVHGIGVQVGDVGDDEGRVVNLLQDWGDELVSRNVVERPRFVDDWERQRICLAHGIHDAGG
jgi:hypothetical protein